MKAVFDTKPNSGYDDDSTRHYHFPKRYLRIVEQSLHDWVVLRRPRANGGNLAYFAVAKVAGIDVDPQDPGLRYARLAYFLPFDAPVPWRMASGYAEEALRNIAQAEVGVFLRGRSVRPISDADFSKLVEAGFRHTFAGLEHSLATFNGEVVGEQSLPDVRHWQITQLLVNRVVRDRNFRTAVCRAYDYRCAITRLKLIDRNGLWEANAAHIWGVASGGPDVTQNGLALSGTIHWLFDRHLITLSEDYRLIVATQHVPPEIQRAFGTSDRSVHLPMEEQFWPHPKYLARHRERYDQLQNGIRS